MIPMPNSLRLVRRPGGIGNEMMRAKNAAGTQSMVGNVPENQPISPTCFYIDEGQGFPPHPKRMEIEWEVDAVVATAASGHGKETRRKLPLRHCVWVYK